MTSYALDRGLSFPFVTVPDFEVRASKARELSGAEGIVWNPLVDESQRRAWENYTTYEAPIWMRESFDTLGMNEELPTVAPFVHSFGDPVKGPIFTDSGPLAQKYSITWYVFRFLAVLPLAIVFKRSFLSMGYFYLNQANKSNNSSNGNHQHGWSDDSFNT